MKQILTVGTAKKVITPPLGTPLYGYPRVRLAESVGDDLNVIAAVFGFGEERAVLLSADICSCPAELVQQIREGIEAKTGIRQDRITFGATHTHSGPNLNLHTSGWGAPNLSYIENILIPQSIQATEEAAASMLPALFGVGTTDSEVGCNRRLIDLNGMAQLGQNPWGVFDKTMTVMSFKNAETGACILNIVHYSAHATASGANVEITRDWPGTMKDVLERETGGITMFLPGAIGECGPRCPNGGTTQSYEAAKELGHQAGLDAVKALRAIRDWRRGPMSVINGNITVPYDPLPPKEEAESQIKWLESEENRQLQEKAEDKEYQKAHDLTELIRWKNIFAEYESGDVKKEFVYPQTILAFGNTAIVPLPFELFVYPTVQLQLYSRFSHTLSVSNTNGTRAYLPSQDQLCRGGYEVWQFRYHNTYKLVDNADDYLVRENLKLLNQAFEKQAEQN